MRHSYLVAYDISSSPKRLAQTSKCMCGYGNRIQYSVFLCDLTPRDKIIMENRLKTIIDLQEDQVLIVKLGPAQGSLATSIESIGVPYEPPGSSFVV